MQKVNCKVSNTPEPLSFRGIFLHAWDLADDGTDFVLDELRQAALNTLCLASTYHSGWFIHPHNSRHRAFMTEGSVCYFHPEEALYKKTRLRPKIAGIARNHDWFAEVSRRLGDLQLVSWTVGTHNTGLGTAYPELTQHNIYGDCLPHALCPAQPEVREYLHALCRDLATHYPLWGIQLETFGWLGFVHGHHHERDLVGLTPLEQELMGWCMCSACTQLASAAGVEMAPVKIAIKKVLDGAFSAAPERPQHHSGSLAEFETTASGISEFCAWRKQFTVSLIRDLKQKALEGTNCRLLLETDFDPALAGVVDGFACTAYQQSPAQTFEICRRAAGAIPPQWTGLHQCLIQLGLGVPKSELQLREIVGAVCAAGCTGINFYNRSESPPKMLSWMTKVMSSFHENH